MHTRTRTPADPASASATWYHEAIIYELHVRAFSDSNADGIGDFPGLTQKLGYLHDLGVTALWLLPFYPSPLKDDGYDIADYRLPGRIGENIAHVPYFRRFTEKAHGCNVGLSQTPNAGGEPRARAGAKNERRLLRVGSSAWFK